MKRTQFIESLTPEGAVALIHGVILQSKADYTEATQKIAEADKIITEATEAMKTATGEKRREWARKRADAKRSKSHGERLKKDAITGAAYWANSIGYDAATIVKGVTL